MKILNKKTDLVIKQISILKINISLTRFLRNKNKNYVINTQYIEFIRYYYAISLLVYKSFAVY